MYWDDLSLQDAGEWAYQQGRTIALPPSLWFGPPARQVQAAHEIIARRGWRAEISSSAGTVRMPAEAADDEVWEDALGYVHSNDLHREVDEQPELRAEEQPPAFVRRLAVTRIEGLPSLGPGGRMTLFDLPSGSFVDVSVRPKAELVGAAGWRDPREVQAAVMGMVGEARGYRLRGALGYSEPSPYEVARSARPSFVFVLDADQVPGAPHWRVSIAVPATVDDDGDGGAVGRGQDSDWCV
jgi:hypothetical protein